MELMCQQPWKEKSLGEVHNGSIIPINWTLLNRGCLSQSKKRQFQESSCGCPGNPGGGERWGVENSAVCLGGWCPRALPSSQSGAQKLPVAPPTLSLALPSRVRLFTHKATSAGPASPRAVDHSAHPQQSHSPAPLHRVAQRVLFPQA